MVLLCVRALSATRSSTIACPMPSTFDVTAVAGTTTSSTRWPAGTSLTCMPCTGGGACFT